MLNRRIVAAVLLLCATYAHAATTYYIVVPVPNRTGPAGSPAPAPNPAPTPTPAPEPEPDPIVVTLNAMTLPTGKVGTPYAGFSFKDLLQVTGDSTFTGAGVSWEVSQGSLPAGLALNASTGAFVGTPQSETGSGGQSFQVTATYKSKSGSRAYNISVSSKEPRSCREYLEANPTARSDWYQFDMDGAGPRQKSYYYCDMTSDGGGWTNVVRQLEASPTTTWNDGGSSGGSWAMTGASIPPHTQVAFGKDYVATAVDYVNWTYTGLDIPKTLVTSPKTGISYHVHRSSTGNYSDHDPESGYGVAPTSAWRDTLTFDRVGGVGYTWAFSLHTDTPATRGYALQGARYGTSDSFAWTVWVR